MLYKLYPPLSFFFREFFFEFSRSVIDIIKYRFFVAVGIVDC